MTMPVNRPDEWKVLGDHERRVRDLEAICCGAEGTGFEGAVAIRDRAGSWYGMGDDEDDTCVECITNYAEGSDGDFTQGDDCEAPGAAVGGADAASAGVNPFTPGDSTPWALAQDGASYRGCAKRYCEPGGYPDTPFCEIDDGLDGSGDWTFNLWVCWDDWPTICEGIGIISYGSGGVFGHRTAGGGGSWLGTTGTTVADTDPEPVPLMAWNFNDGGAQSIVFGDAREMDTWRMITVTWDASEMTLTGYINGGFVGDFVCSTVQSLTPGTITIGTINYGGFLGTNYGGWNGAIDEVGVWSEVLPGEDVYTIFFAGDSPDLTTVAFIDSGEALCGEPMVADGNGGATWGNSCSLDAPFVMPAVGSVTVQDVVDALVAMGLVTQGT